jgi:LPXTG-motif cell wall-anchored protein
VLVEGNSSYTDFSMYTKADKTNMWQAQAVELDSTVVYAVVIGVAVMIVAAVLLLRRKK